MSFYDQPVYKAASAHAEQLRRTKGGFANVPGGVSPHGDVGRPLDVAFSHGVGLGRGNSRRSGITHTSPQLLQRRYTKRPVSVAAFAAFESHFGHCWRPACGGEAASDTVHHREGCKAVAACEGGSVGRTHCRRSRATLPRTAYSAGRRNAR